MADIGFNDGYETFTINNDPKRVIRINPRDVNILDRFETAMRELREESASMSDVKVNADGSPAVDADTLEAYTKKLNEFNRLINDKLNYIFAADVSSAAFGMQSPLSLVGDEGKFLFEVFLEAALLAVREKIEASADLVDRKSNKYTEKYVKAAEKGQKYPFPAGNAHG